MLFPNLNMIRSSYRRLNEDPDFNQENLKNRLRKCGRLAGEDNTTIYLRPSACPVYCGLLSESHPAVGL